ncbi:MAG: phage tail tape measure protein [Thermodesulfobacteriota bacterium]|nr:phage tail tape measure protein [Thermodesulfobacteriota bacterium]
MSVVNIPTSASGYHQSIVSQARSAQRTVNRMQMSPTLNPQGMTQPLGKITNSASEFQKSMDASAARVFAFGAAVGVINGISDAFRGMVESMAEVEKSLKDIQVVMEASDAAMRSFGDGLFDVARNTATSFDLVAASATELARQGLSSEETLARVNSALILSRLSGLDTVKSTETLTAAINSFNKEGITHTQVINRMANVDAAFAVSSADLAEAISRAGAVAQSSGVAFNELAAIVTAVQQRTARGGSVIGNGFKSIFTRIKRSGVREALEEIGVATKNNDGSFRSSIAILEDYAKVYQGLSDTQKAYTSEQIAGVFQIQNLQALIQDLNSGYSVYNKALSVANNTTNEAIQRNDALNTTMSALFAQTTLSAKELAATIGEVGFSENFKEILTFLNNLAKKLNEIFSEDKGSDFAQNLIRGIGSFLTGPGLVIMGAAFLKIFGLVAKFAKEAFADLLGVNKEAKRQQSLQVAIGQILSTNAGVYQKILAAGTSTAKQQQIILNLIKQETAERLKQEALIKRIAGGRVLAGIGAGEQGFIPMGKKSAQRKGRKTLGMASGFLPSIGKEMSDINSGIGGARKGDKPVVLKGHKMSGGRRENVVAHTGEWVVSNFAGTGGDAIFNRDMIKKMGKPKGAKKITASSGFIPNYAKPVQKKYMAVQASARRLDWRQGGRSLISKFSDGVDMFKAMIKINRMEQTSKQLGSRAHAWVTGKPMSGDSIIKGEQIPEKSTKAWFIRDKNKDGTKYKLNFSMKNVESGLRKEFGTLMDQPTGKSLLTTVNNLTDEKKTPRFKDKVPKKVQGRFAHITNLLKGLQGEKLARSKLRKDRGSGDYIRGNESFDLKYKNKKGEERFSEVKAVSQQDLLPILKKGATQFLRSTGKDFKNEEKDIINVNKGSSQISGFLELMTMADTEVTRPSFARGYVPNFGKFNLFEGVRKTKGGKDYIWENELAQAKHQLPEGTKFTPWAKNPKMIFVSGHKAKPGINKNKISFKSSSELEEFGKFAAQEGYPEIMASIVKNTGMEEASKKLMGNTFAQRAYDRKAGKKTIQTLPNEIDIDNIKNIKVGDFKSFEHGQTGANLRRLYTPESFDRVKNEKFIQKPIGQREYMPLGGATEPKMANIYDSDENIFRSIQKARGKNLIDSSTIESLYKKFLNQKSSSQFSLGYIPNLASLLKARKMHDGFGPQMGGSGVRSKKFKDSGSFLEYQGNELEFIQSMRKGDANLLFDRFVRQKGSVYSPGIKQNRSFKQGSKTNFEDLIYAFPQLQYRLKKGFETTGRYVGANGESFRFLNLKDLKEQINKKYSREEFRQYLGGEGVVGMGKMDVQDLTTNVIKGRGDDIYKNYARGFIPNFARVYGRRSKKWQEREGRIKALLESEKALGHNVKFKLKEKEVRKIRSKNMFQQMWLESYFKKGKKSDYDMLLKMGYDKETLLSLRKHVGNGGIVDVLSKGYLPNFAKGVQTSKGFFTTQKLRRLTGGDFAKSETGEKLFLNQFSRKDQDAIKNFQAPNSKMNIARAKAASKDNRNKMPTIDASRQATMLVATNGLRRKVDATYKHKDINYRLKYRVEGLKPSRLKSTESSVRNKIENILISESNNLAKNLSGTGQFGASTPAVQKLSNAGSVGSAAGTVFESAVSAIGKNRLFTSNNARFDISGMPDDKLKNLFGYYTPFADAKIGMTPDTKRDFHSKLMTLPTSAKNIAGSERKKQGAIARGVRKKYGPPTVSEGFIPNFARPVFAGRSRRLKTGGLFSPRDFKRLEKTRDDINLMGGIYIRPGKITDNSMPFGALSSRDLSLLENNLKKYGKKHGVDNALTEKVLRAYGLNPQFKDKVGSIKERGDYLYNWGKNISDIKGYKKRDEERFDFLRSSRINRAAASGFTPNFTHPLSEAIQREASALRDRKLPVSSIRIEKSNRLRNNKNPIGLAVTNRFDEPGGLQQGINRSNRMGIDPASHGALAAEGYVPNFILPALAVAGRGALMVGQVGLRGAAMAGRIGMQGMAHAGRYGMQGARYGMQGMGHAARYGMRGMGHAGRYGMRGLSRSRQLLRDRKALRLRNKRRMRDAGKEPRSMFGFDSPIGQGASMGGMFLGPMVAEQVRNGEQAMSGSKGMMHDTLMGASYGSMFGVPGMIAGAGAGLLHGELKSESRDQIKNMTEGIDKAKRKLDKILSDTSEIERYGEALGELQVAMEVGDAEGIVEANKEIRESLRNIKDPELAAEINSIATSSMSATEKLQLMGEAVEGLKNRAELFEAAINAGQEIRDFKEQNDPLVKGGEDGSMLGNAKNSVLAFLGSVAGYGDYEQNKRFLDKKDSDIYSNDPDAAKDQAKRLMPNIVNQIKIDAEKQTLKELSSGEAQGRLNTDIETVTNLQGLLKEIDILTEQAKTDTTGKFVGDGEGRKALDKAMNEARDAFAFDNFEDKGLGFAMQEIERNGGITTQSLKEVTKELEAMKKVADSLKGLEGQTTDQIKKAISKDANLETAASTITEDIQFRSTEKDLQLLLDNKFESTDFAKGLRETAGGNQVATDIGNAMEESEIFKMALIGELMDSLKSTQTGFIDMGKALEVAAKVMNDHNNAGEKVRLSYERMIAAQEMAENALERFSNGLDNSRGALENIVGFLSDGNQYLRDTNSITSQEANDRQFKLQQKAMDITQELDLKEGLMNLIGNSIDISSMFNPDKTIKTEMGVPDKNPTSIVGQMKKDIDDELAPQQEGMANEFANFMNNNQDGNITLDEIKGLMINLNNYGSEGNKIAKKAQILIDKHQMKAQRQREAMLMQRELQEAREASDFLQRTGASIMGINEERAIADLSPSLDMSGANSVIRSAVGGLNPNAADASLISNMDQFASIMNIPTEEILGVNSDDLALTRSLANLEKAIEALRIGNGGSLPPGMNEFFNDLRQRLFENHDKTVAARGKVEEYNKHFLEGGLDMALLGGPMEQTAAHLAFINSNGIKISNFSELTGFSATEPPGISLNGEPGFVSNPLMSPPGDGSQLSNPGGVPDMPELGMMIEALKLMQSEGVIVKNIQEIGVAIAENLKQVKEESSGELIEVMSSLNENIGITSESLSSFGENIQVLSESLAPISESASLLSETFTTVSDTMNSFPELLRGQLEEVTFQHAVTGNIEMNFNSSVVQGVLGPAMYDQLKKILVEPMILDYLSKAIGTRIDPQGRLN